MRRRKSGFTLIELMVVVGIIGLLSTIALPWYLKSVFRAQRTEAVLGLEGANTAQVAYVAAYDEFADSFQKLPEFRIDGGLVQSPTSMKGRRYTYTLTRPWGPQSFYITASCDLDGDPWPDLLAVYETDI